MIFSWLKKLSHFASKLIALFLVMMIWLIRPMLGPMNICPYSIGCTQFALQQLQEQPLLLALKNICGRLIQCHPFGNRKI
ncbi:MAG: membrane protein insertion efficiency factor YidD [Candidatus Dependentiae bacterium]|nr:membrane protein insertion efficiency factor YidD [Candidatus Dependentiae bacterium]